MKYLKDEEFIRGNCPMTKQDIRILTMARLQLQENSRFLDVGTGTGTVAIEGSRIAAKGQVISIEKDEEAYKTAVINKEKFQCSNLDLIKGDALEVLKNMQESFDGIFIGGSGGDLKEIIIECCRLLNKGGRLVLNFVTIENLYRAIEVIRDLEMDFNCTQVAITNTRGKSLMLSSNNPIFIIDTEKK